MNYWELIITFCGVAAPLTVAGIAAIVRLGSKQATTEVKVEMMMKDMAEIKIQVYSIAMGLAEMRGAQRGPDRQLPHGEGGA